MTFCAVSTVLSQGEQMMSRCVSLIAVLLFATTAALAREMVDVPAQKVPLLYQADVVIVGGGLSGVGAAVGAARSGAKTIVIERTGYLGGWIRGNSLGNVIAINGWRPSLREGVLKDICQGVVDYGMEGYPDLESTLKDRKSTRLNSSHMSISYAVFCL